MYNIYYLRGIVKYCQSNNIKLILFRSPIHKLYPKVDELELRKLLLSDFKNNQFWDYSDYPLKDEEYGDLDHINAKGAKIISKVVNIRLNHKNNFEEGY